MDSLQIAQTVAAQAYVDVALAQEAPDMDNFEKFAAAGVVFAPRPRSLEKTAFIGAMVAKSAIKNKTLKHGILGALGGAAIGAGGRAAHLGGLSLGAKGHARHSAEYAGKSGWGKFVDTITGRAPSAESAVARMSRKGREAKSAVDGGSRSATFKQHRQMRRGARADRVQSWRDLPRSEQTASKAAEIFGKEVGTSGAIGGLIGGIGGAAHGARTTKAARAALAKKVNIGAAAGAAGLGGLALAS
jgi:hypothetical protein